MIWSTDCRVRWCAIQSKALLSAPVSLAVPDGDDKVGLKRIAFLKKMIFERNKAPPIRRMAIGSDKKEPQLHDLHFILR